MWGEIQEKEINSISRSNVMLELSKEDIRRLHYKAGRVGLTVSVLLENFIGDLVGGTYSNGSDERDLAGQWFERCWFSIFPKKTLLRYLIEEGRLEGVIDLIDDIKTAKEELEYADSHPDEFIEEDIRSWKEDLVEWEKELNDTFLEYQEWSKDELPGFFEEEIARVVDWYNKVLDIDECL